VGQFRWAQGTDGRPLRLRLDDAPTEDMRLDVSDPNWSVTHRRQGSVHEWTLTPPSQENRGPIMMQIVGRVSAPEGKPFAFPRPAGFDAPWRDLTVTLAGANHQVAKAEGLQLLSLVDVSTDKPAGTGMLAFKKMWKITDAAWHLEITPLRQSA